MKQSSLPRGFFPYALAAFLIGIVGGFSSVLGPAFVSDLGIAYSNTTWTALAQAMSTAALAPVLGKAGDLLGRRIALLAGMLLFTLGNVLTALAGSLAFMLLARFTVGVGTAAMAPVILSYIVTEFPQEQSARGFSLYMLISSASVIIGPTAGSLMIAAWGWRAMVWVCVGICAAVLAVCALTLEKSGRPAGISAFDGAGAVLVPLFFSLLLCIPSVGQNIGWHTPAFRWILALSAAALTALIIAERRAARPILPGAFLKRPVFLLSVAALFLTQGLMQANMTNTIVFVNCTQPENTAVSGYAVSAMYLGMSLGAVLIGPLADRFPAKFVLSGSFLLTGVGCGLPLLFTENTSPALLMTALGLLGFGLGSNGTVFLKVVLSGLDPGQAGAYTGTYGLFRDLAAPFGVAVFVPMFTNRITALTGQDLERAEAAVSATGLLARTELLCVVLGLIAVLCIPRPPSNR